MEQELNQVLSELTKIESAAAGINENLTSDKAALIAEYEQKKKDLMKQLYEDEDAQISAVKAQFSADNAQKIADLKEKTEVNILNLEKAFAEHHEEWADEIFRKIITER